MSELPADPPIDDESYRYDDTSFPTPQQKHLLLVQYFLTCLNTRTVECATTLLVALVYPSSLLNISLYALCLIIFVPLFEQLGRQFTRKWPRIRLASLSLLCQCLGAIVALSAIARSLNARTELENWLCFALMLATMLAQRVSFLLYRHSIEADWVSIMTSDITIQLASVKGSIDLLGIVARCAAPLLGATVIVTLGIERAIRLLQSATALSLAVEYSLLRLLYSICFVLRLPRPQKPRTCFTTWARPPLKRLYRYLVALQRPVVASAGILLIKCSILSMCPQFMYYLINNGVSLLIVALLRSYQLMFLVAPGRPNSTHALAEVLGPDAALCLLISATVACVAAFWYGKILLCGVFAVLARTGVSSLDALSQRYIEEVSTNQERLHLYHEVESNAEWYVDITAKCLMLIWYKPEDFAWPVAISASTTIVGAFIVFSSRWL